MKPFKTRETGRPESKARLRRTDEPAPEMLQIGDIVIDVVEAHSVKRDGETGQPHPARVRPAGRAGPQARGRSSPGKCCSSRFWGYRHAADARLVNVHVQRLRAKIEKDPEHPEIVVTVRSVGYKAAAWLGPGSLKVASVRTIREKRNWITAFWRSAFGKAIIRWLPRQVRRGLFAKPPMAAWRGRADQAALAPFAATAGGLDHPEPFRPGHRGARLLPGPVVRGRAAHQRGKRRGIPGQERPRPTRSGSPP